MENPMTTPAAREGAMILTWKYRLKDRSARKRLRDHAFACNQVWNYCVAFQRDREARYIAGAPKSRWPSTFDLHKLTSGTSKELGILSGTVNEVCRYFVQSRDGAHHTPRFRASGGPRRALGWIPFKGDDARRIDGNSVIYLGKRYRWFGDKRRPLPDTAKGGAFVEDARGRWYVCFLVEVDTLAAGEGSIGIDLGLKTLATCSDGATVPALQHYRRYEAALRIAQRAHNKRRVQAIHAKIANARRDQHHKATAKIARENRFIFVGNVNAAGLAKTRMAKSVLDAGWSQFRSQLEYKARRHQAEFKIVDEAWTSQTCSDCGVIGGPKGIAGLGIRAWECADCGAVHDRDVNAARNILRLGQSALPHADESRRAA